MSEFKCKFGKQKVSAWANAYLINLSPPAKILEDYLEKTTASTEQSKINLDKSLLTKFALWKSPRSAQWIEKNTPGYIEEITKFSLSTSNERLRIESLTLITGVSWPTASVILHFTHKDRYPILDFRALWSLNCSPPPSSYNFEFWWTYVEHCRMLSNKYACSMRTLDRALWKYSKEKQVSSE